MYVEDKNSRYSALLQSINRVLFLFACYIFQGAKRNLTVTNESKSRVLLNVTYGLESDEPLHNCWEPIKIECLVGKKTHSFTAEHTCVCKSEFLCLIGVQNSIREHKHVLIHRITVR